MDVDHDPGAMSIGKRRRRIAGIVEERGFVQVRDLAQLLRVSEVTIRLDLRSLEKLGGLHRVRGGATATAPRPRGPAPEDWSDPAVSAMAAAFVRSGDTIVLDGGHGVRSVAEALVGRCDLSDVVVHTDSLLVLAPFTAHCDRFTVVVPSGRVDATSRVVPDREAEIDADLVILGCAGISADGVLARTEPEAFARRRAAFAGRRGIVIVPPALQQSGDYVACSLNHVDACITSEHLAGNLDMLLRTAGVQVFVAS